MTYIGKIKIERTTLAGVNEQVNPPIIATDNLDLNLYDDITSIENWDKYGTNLCTDHMQIRSRMLEVLDSLTWANISSVERDLVIEYYLKETNKDENTANSEKVAHLMGKGLTLDESITELSQAYANHHLKEIIACERRANSSKLYKVIAKYLSLSDAGDLIKISHKLFDLYKTQGIRGVGDGNAGEGLFNFLESTVGTSYENSGLAEQGYTLKTGDINSFITELMDVLRNGNY